MRGLPMSKLCSVVALTAGLAVASAAHADLFSGINSWSTYDRWFGDYLSTTVTWTNGGLGSLRVQESGYELSTGFATRNHAYLSVGGTPIQFDPNQSFRFEVTATINSTGGFNTEAGIVFGTSPNLPTSAGADTGNLMYRAGTSPEIAAFGSTSPFFSSNFGVGQAAGFAAPLTGTPVRLTFLYETSDFGTTYTYGVDNVFITLGGSKILPGSYLGVYAQGPNNFPVTQGYTKDVIFTNATITIPAPASAGLLGAAGLLAMRRRRR